MLKLQRYAFISQIFIEHPLWATRFCHSGYSNGKQPKQKTPGFVDYLLLRKDKQEILYTHTHMGASQEALVVKSSPPSAGDVRNMASIRGSGRSPGGGRGNPLQYSCLENPWTEESGWLQSTGSQTAGHDLKWLSTQTYTHTHTHTHTHTLGQMVSI